MTEQKEGKGSFCGELAIVLAGEAGQGIQSIETILMGLLKRDGFNVFAAKEYMSRVRGGINSTEIRVSERAVCSHVDRIDLFVPLNSEAIPHLKKRISRSTVVIGDNTQVKYDRLIDIPFQRIATELGNILFANTVAVGVICGILDVSEELLFTETKSYYFSKGEDIAVKNIEAVKRGYALGKELAANGIIKTEIKKDCAVADHLLLSGADAVALGALAGGCDSVFAYPMTPSTSVFTALAGYSTKVGIAVEQGEDEIGVMNMALGAWYAGGHAMVSTSGGGFALMTEAVSLAGMIESPAVIHLAQRPGPATGLPTRTEQGDLNLALYAGHGYFPRIILAPGTTEEAFYLSRQAFDLADKFQVPVFIMTDQHFVDAYYNIPEIKLEGLDVRKHIIETTMDYKRYALTADGISPRGVPGFGTGLVSVDSDEHDEEGRITEDLDGVRMKMVEKRMKKAALIKESALKPRISGVKNYENLVVSWGSNFNTVKEALDITDDGKTAFTHFPQVYPLHKDTEKILRKAVKLIVIEQNETGQFADLIKLETGIDIKDRILKWNGMPFSVEEIANALKNT
jgi:2-oxoglutarate ferredoxin oxidoreductase subunit alpha